MASLPTEPLGSLPRPQRLLELLRKEQPENTSDPELVAAFYEAMGETAERFKATGSPVITDGEYGKHPDFITYPLQFQSSLSPEGFSLVLDESNICQLPQITQGPFRYTQITDFRLSSIHQYADVPVKQAIISPSTLSLLYPATFLHNYSREDFLEDLLSEHVNELRRCLDMQNTKVQIDFCDGPMALRLDPSGQLLNNFVLLLHMALDCFSVEEQKRLGIYIGTNQADAINLIELLPGLFELPVNSFYMAAANRSNRTHLLNVIRDHVKPNQQVFIGVIDPGNPRMETATEVRDATIEASHYIPPDQLGTTDNSGFAPFAYNPLADWETAFEKIRVRVEGTAQAEKILNGN